MSTVSLMMMMVEFSPVGGDFQTSFSKATFSLERNHAAYVGIVARMHVTLTNRPTPFE